MALSPLQKKLIGLNDESSKSVTGTPEKYLPLDHVYSATTTCISATGSSNVMSKKIKACKRTDFNTDLTNDFDSDSLTHHKKQFQSRFQFRPSSSFLRVYTRQRRKLGKSVSESGSRIMDCSTVNSGSFEVICDGIEESTRELGEIVKRKVSSGNSELVNLGIDSNFGNGVDCSGSRGRRVRSTRNVYNQYSTKDCNNKRNVARIDKVSGDQQKKWIMLSHENVDEDIFIGLKCKVYRPSCNPKLVKVFKGTKREQLQGTSQAKA